MKKSERLLYLAVGAALIGGAVALFGGPVSAIGGVLALLGALGSVILMKFGYMVMPGVSQALGQKYSVEKFYELPPSQDVVVRRGENGLYYAAVFLALEIYDSALEKTPEEIVTYNRAFERLLANLKFPVKLCLLLAPEDISQYRNDLQTKKALFQLQLKSEREKPEPDPTRIDQLEQMIKDIDKQLDMLARGNRPIQVMYYAVVGGVGVSKEAAIEQAKRKAEELKSALETSLNIEVGMLTSNHLLRAIELETFMPASPEDFVEAEP